MFDDLYIHKTLLDDVIKKSNLNFDAFQKGVESSDKDFYYFQTKDLYNVLESYYIDTDRKLVLHKQEYELQEEGSVKSFFGVNLTPVGELQKIEQQDTLYLFFHNCYDTDDDSIYLSFKAHIKNGVLDGDIKLISDETISKKIAEENMRKYSERNEKIQSTIYWKIYRIIDRITYKLSKISNFFYKKASSKFEDESF